VTHEVDPDASILTFTWYMKAFADRIGGGLRRLSLPARTSHAFAAWFGCACPPALANLPRMAWFLFKTEPTTYSFSDLVREQRAVWDGVTNPVALKHLRQAKKGDVVVIYHTGDEKSAVGLAEAVSDAYPDPKAGDPKRVVVDLAPREPLPRPVPLAAIRADATLSGTDLVRIPRLSVVPLSEPQFQQVLKLARG
jgi:predicted RNA-binding protein with PUA-like domain